MDDILVWQAAVLRPASLMASPVPFTRGGGRSLGGIERTIRTDRGYWAIAYKGIALHDVQTRRYWNVLRNALNGRSGLVAVPAWSFDSAPWLAGTVHGRLLTPHSDGSTFSDGSQYSQPGIIVELATAASIGDTEATLRLVYGIDDLSGVRFSYQHALYETGRVTAVDGADWTVEVFPEIRADIPEGAALELDLPTCLVHLATDREMDGSLSRGTFDKADVSFVEAVDYWADLAGA